MIENFLKIRRRELIICLFLIVALLSVYWQIGGYDLSVTKIEQCHLDKPRIFWIKG